jgi:hypothetical protein
MRLKVLVVCMLLLAACFLAVICRLSTGAASAGILVREKSLLIPSNDTQVREFVSHAKEQTQLPDWEPRFWEIASEPVWMQSQEELEELGAALDDQQIRDALDKLAEEKSDAGIVLGRYLVRRWAGKSPTEATQWVAGLPDNDFGHAVSKEVVIPLAEKDLDGAVGWVRQLPEGGNKTAAELSLAGVAANQKEAATAISLVNDLAPGPERDGLLNYSARQWATVDVDGAVSWINQVQDPALQEQMLDNVAVDMGVQDPFNAASFAATALPSGQGQNEAVVTIIRFWAASAPEQAAAWVAQFPEGDLRVAATENLIDVWGKDDPAAVGAWVSAISKSE